MQERLGQLLDHRTRVLVCVRYAGASALQDEVRKSLVLKESVVFDDVASFRVLDLRKAIPTGVHSSGSTFVALGSACIGYMIWWLHHTGRSG